MSMKWFVASFVFALGGIYVFAKEAPKRHAPWFIEEKTATLLVEGTPTFRESAGKTAEAPPADMDDKTMTAISRYHDDEAGVTCWVTWPTHGYNGTGISCLPDSAVKKPKQLAQR